MSVSVFYIMTQRPAGGAAKLCGNVEGDQMTDGELLRLMRERHSVRTYLNKPIEDEKAQLIRAKVAELNAESGLHAQFMTDASGVYGGIMLKMMGWKNVPGYFALVGKNEPGLDERCGYFGEQLVLFCQGLGLNTCWAGMAKASKVKADLEPGERMCITIAVGYGATQGKPHKSKAFPDVVDVRSEYIDGLPDWFKKGVEYALLAPTAMNQQKFKLGIGRNDEPEISISANGPFVRVDLGIAAYHFNAATGRKAKVV